MDHARSDRILEVEEVAGVLRVNMVGPLSRQIRPARRARVLPPAPPACGAGAPVRLKPGHYVCVAVLAATIVAVHGAGGDAGEWRYYSADNDATKYSPLDQINKDNVAQLRVAWRRPQVDPALLAANPDSASRTASRSRRSWLDGVLYASNGVGLAEAFDPETGKTLWTQQPLIAGRKGCPAGGAHRGVAYWGRAPRRASSPCAAQYLFALDPKTGPSRFAGFGDGGKSISASASVRASRVPLERRAADRARRDRHGLGDGRSGFGDRRSKAIPATCAPTTCAPASCAGPSTSSRPRTMPRRSKTWDGDSWQYTGAGNVWSLMSADDELGYVYLPTTSVDQRHVRRPSPRRQPLQHSSIVCLDAATGKRVWHLPDRASRSVRLRQSGRADPRRHHRRRPADQGASRRSRSSRGPTCSIA